MAKSMPKSNRSAQLYPLLREIDAEPVEGKPGEFRVTLVRQRKAVTLGSGALAVAEAFDGVRSCAQIERDLSQDGLQLPGEGFVLGLALTLERAGLVRLLDTPGAEPAPPRVHEDMISINPLRHRCLGCGRGCQGHAVGPLDAPFLERVDRVKAELAELYDDIAARDEVVVPLGDGREGMRMALDNGGCVFLGEDRLCRIHKHLGSAAKPLVCRFFPVQIVETEDSLRVGVLRCYEAHKSFRDGDEQAPADITGVGGDERQPIDRRGPNPYDPQHFAQDWVAGTLGDQNQVLEQRLMTLLERPAVTWDALITFALDTVELEGKPSKRRRPSRRRPKTLKDAAFGPALVGPLQRYGAAALEHLNGAFDGAEDDSYQDHVVRLLRFLSGLKPRPFPGLTPGAHAYAMHLLREWCFLREWHQHPSLEVSVVVVVLGVIASGWHAHDNPGPDDAQALKDDPQHIPDAFAHPLTTWMRLMHQPANVALFLGDDDGASILSDMARARKGQAPAKR